MTYSRPATGAEWASYFGSFFNPSSYAPDFNQKFADAATAAFNKAKEQFTGVTNPASASVISALLNSLNKMLPTIALSKFSKTEFETLTKSEKDFKKVLEHTSTFFSEKTHVEIATSYLKHLTENVNALSRESIRDAYNSVLVEIDQARKNHKKTVLDSIDNLDKDLSSSLKKYHKTKDSQQLLQDFESVIQCLGEELDAQPKSEYGVFFKIAKNELYFDSLSFLYMKKVIESGDVKRIDEAFKDYNAQLKNVIDRMEESFVISSIHTFETIINELVRSSDDKDSEKPLDYILGGHSEKNTKLFLENLEKNSKDFSKAAKALYNELSKEPLFDPLCEAKGAEKRVKEMGKIRERFKKLPKLLDASLRKGKITDTFFKAAAQSVEKTVADFFRTTPPQSKNGSENWTLTSLIRQTQQLFTGSLSSTDLLMKLKIYGMVATNGFEAALKEIKKERKRTNDESLRKVENQLEKAVENLKKADLQGNVDLYEKSLKECEEALSALDICLNAIGMPKSLNGILLNGTAFRNKVLGGNTKETLADNLHALHKVKKETGRIEQNKIQMNYKEELGAQRSLFAENTTKFLALKSVFEFSALGIDLQMTAKERKEFYNDLIQKSGNGKLSLDTLKTLVTEELDKLNIGFHKKAFAKIVLYFAIYFIEDILSKGAENIFNEIIAEINAHKDNQFEFYRNGAIKVSNDYVSILSGALHRIGRDDNYEGSINKMLKKELSKKEHNENYELEALYEEVISTVLKKMTNRFFAWIISAIMGKKEPYIDDMLKEGLGDYQHQVNLLVVEVMEDFWDEISTPSSEKNAKTKKEQEELSTTLREEIAPLIKNFLEVLHLSRQDTPGGLRAAVRGSLKNKITTGIDDLFIEGAVKSASEAIATGLQTFLTEEKVHELMYKLTEMLNNSYKTTKPATAQEIEDVEKRRVELSERILNFQVKKGVEDTLKLTNEKEQIEVNETIKALKARLHRFNNRAIRDLKAIESRAVGSDKWISKVNRLRRHIVYFMERNNRLKMQIETGKMSADSKDRLCELFDIRLGKATNPLTETCVKIIKLSNHLDIDTSARATLKHINSRVSKIEKIVNEANPKDGDIIQAEAQAVKAQAGLSTLLEFYNSKSVAALHKILGKKVSKMQKELKALKTHAAAFNFGKKESKTDSLTNKFFAMRKKHPHRSHPKFNEKTKEMRDKVLEKLDKAIENPKLKQKLKDKFTAIGKGMDARAVKKAIREYNALLKGVMKKAADKRNQAQASIKNSAAEITKAINDSPEIKSKDKTKSHNRHGIQIQLGRVQEDLKGLKKWTQKNLDPIPYINLTVLPQKMIEQVGSHFAYNRVKEKIDAVINFARDPIHMRYFALHRGLIHWLKRQKASN